MGLERLPYVVIGSGPSGTSCAQALLAQGCRVLMIDGGANLEPAAAQRLTQLSAQPPGAWTGENTLWMRQGMQAEVEGITLKLTYGSDFPFRPMPGSPLVQGEHVNTKYSMGKGGFSTVWGTAVLPFRQQDMVGWPVSAEELAPHYRGVLGFMPVAQTQDRLAELFPTFARPGDASGAMPLSPQAAALYRKLERRADRLEQQGLRFGHSRLAVNQAGQGAPGACVRCGLCMYGCPYGLLYNTAQTVDSLRDHPNFTYVAGHVAQRIEERADEVLVHTLRNDGTAEIVRGTRVFVGGGVLSTTALLLRSLEAFDRPVTFKESHYFLIPSLRLSGVSGFARGDLHTLAQLFLEINDPQVSPYTVHLQTYTYNDLFEAAIHKTLGPAGKVFPWKAFLQRLFLFQGYLHSEHSAVTTATLRRGAVGHDGQTAGPDDVLHLDAPRRPETSAALKRLVRKLWKLQPLTGMSPLQPLIREGEPGRGFHTGCSFPMSAHPEGLESDTLGRPGGLRRTHAIDASVLPSVPATTITFTIMANAHRIGTAVAREDA